MTLKTTALIQVIIVVESYPNCDQELFHVYAATLIRVETGKELPDFLVREFHASLLHPLCEFFQIQRLAPVIIYAPEEPVDTQSLVITPVGR
jgi:hypothetical protein